MSSLGKNIIKALKEALAHARGEKKCREVTRTLKLKKRKKKRK